MSIREPRSIAAIVLAVVTLLVGGFVVARIAGEGDATARTIESEPSLAAPPGTARVTVEIPAGASVDEIVQTLVDAGVVTDAESFRTTLGFTGVGPALQAGRFELLPDSPPLEVLRALRAGPDLTERITFRAGLRIEEIGETLEREGLFTAGEWTDAVANAPSTPLAATRPEGASLLGYLLPGTYEIDDKTTATSLLQAMLDRFDEEVTPDLLAEAESRGMSLYEVLTLAAIVEREAVHEEEAPTIASVFLNRLHDGIALQADPTVQFALTIDPERGAESVREFGWWKQELTEADLGYDSPYNTYVYPGLPPGPIANPSIEAIRAVIEPAQTDYYYFVAAPACDGTHLFSATLEEHNANVQRFMASDCAP